MSVVIALPAHGGIVMEKATLGLFNLGKLFVRNEIDHGLIIRSLNICSFWIVI